MSYFWRTKQVEIFGMYCDPGCEIEQLSIVRRESGTSSSIVNSVWFFSWISEMDKFVKTGPLFFVGFGGFIGFISMLLMFVHTPKWYLFSSFFLGSFSSINIWIGKSLMFWVFPAIATIVLFFGVQPKIVHPLLPESIILSISITTSIIPIIFLATLFYEDSLYDVIERIFDQMKRYFPKNYESLSIVVTALMTCKYLKVICVLWVDFEIRSMCQYLPVI